MILYAKVKNYQLEFDNQQELQETLFNLEGKKVIISIEKETGVRTLKQNSALHKGFQILANTLNEKGLDMKTVLKPSVDIYWTTQTVKDYLYKPILKALTTKESTTEMDKSEPSQAWDIMFKFLGEKHQVDYLPFPSKEKEKLNIDYPENNQEVKF